MEKLFVSKLYSDGYVDVTDLDTHKVHVHYTTKQVENMFKGKDVYGLGFGRAYYIMEFATEQEMYEHTGKLIDQFDDNGRLYGVFEVPSYESMAYFVGTKKPKEANSNVFVTEEGFTDQWMSAAKFKDPTEAYKLCNSLNRQRPNEFGVYITGKFIKDDYQLYDEWVQLIHSEVEPKELRVCRKSDLRGTFVAYKLPNDGRSMTKEFKDWLVENEFLDPEHRGLKALKDNPHILVFQPGITTVRELSEFLQWAVQVKPNTIELLKRDALVDYTTVGKMLQYSNCIEGFYCEKPKDIYKAEYLTVDRHYMDSNGKAAVAPAGNWAVESPECYYEYLSDEDFKRLYMEIK